MPEVKILRFVQNLVGEPHGRIGRIGRITSGFHMEKR